MGYPVNPSARPRPSAVPIVGVTPTPFITVNGAASAGSKHLLGSADALTEQVRVQFTEDDDVRNLTVHCELDRASHEWVAMVTFDPGDDIAAADRLNAQGPDVKVVLGGSTRDFTLNVATRNVYILAIKAAGSTAANCVGRIWLEAGSHA